MPLRPVTTWTLEMPERPHTTPRGHCVSTPTADAPDVAPGPHDDMASRPEDVRIDLVPNPSPEFARYLYAVVGGPWTWTDRLGWTREQWLADLGVTGTETYVAYVGGEPAGYVQIQPTPVGAAEARGRASVEIRYFGLVETAIGRGLGRTLLAHGIDAAWTLAERHKAPATQRVWVHTCSLDGPAALRNYERRGFVVIDETTELMDYPAQPLGAWRSAGGPA